MKAARFVSLSLGLLSVTSLRAALHAQHPFAGAPCLIDMRVNDASFAAMAQQAFRGPAFDPRHAEGQSIRVQLLHVAAPAGEAKPGAAPDLGHRACATSVGRPLPAGVFCEMQITPRHLRAAYALEFEHLPRLLRPFATAWVRNSGWRRDSVGTVTDMLVDAAHELDQIESIGLVFTGDPRTSERFGVTATVVVRESSALQKAFHLVEPRGSVPDIGAVDSMLSAYLDVGPKFFSMVCEAVRPLQMPQVKGEKVQEELSRRDKEVLALFVGTAALQVHPGPRGGVFAMDVTDAAAFSKLERELLTLTWRENSTTPVPADAQLPEPSLHRGVPVRSAKSGARPQFTATIGTTHVTVSAADAEQRVHTLIDRSLDAGAAPRIAMKPGEALRLAIVNPQPGPPTSSAPLADVATLQMSVAMRRDGLVIECQCTRSPSAPKTGAAEATDR